MLYVGVDAHSKTSWITVMDEKGKILKREQINSCRKDVRQSLGCYRQPVKAVVEASRSWGPIYDWLDEIADDVILAHPAKVRAIAEARIKTDKIDSETLAHLLRADLIPQAYAPSKDIRAIKRVLRQRMFFVRVRQGGGYQGSRGTGELGICDPTSHKACYFAKATQHETQDRFTIDD